MRTVARRHNPFNFLGSMAGIAAASFIVGFVGWVVVANFVR
jgi:hypothetical protein